jgi:hypothetical protein
MSGIVRTIEFLGSRSLIRVDVGPVLVTAFIASEAEVRIGERIGLKPTTPTSVCWFDLETSQALPRVAVY